MEPTTQTRPEFGGLLTVFFDLAVSIGGYYALRAAGVSVIWSLTIPGIVVGVVASYNTLRRGKLDVVGVLVLVELAATLSLSFITNDPRIAASRQALYIAIGGLFCLGTLFGRRPFAAAATPSLATFGDPVRARAFELAWQEHPRYRRQQWKLTLAIGAIMIADAVIRVLIIYSFPASRIGLTLLLSNIAGLVMIVVIGIVARILITPARQIVLDIVAQLKSASAGQEKLAGQGDDADSVASGSPNSTALTDVPRREERS